MRFSLTCKQYIEEAETSISDKDKFDISLTCLLKNIEPFDIANFKKLLGDYHPQILRVKDKDIYLLLGGTGVGKSTTIHFLCGSKMKMDKDG